MRSFLQRVLRWDEITKNEQEALHARFDKYRYWGYFYISLFICLFPIPLARIFTFTLSDKEAPGKHHYGWAYDRNFRRFKYKRTKILEIGIGGYEFSLGGQSLNSWQSYFPFGRIIGADIKDSTVLGNFRTAIYRVDQSDSAGLRKMAEQEQYFDIIVDDGSHINEHQILTFGVLFNYLSEGGIYVIEDVQTSYWDFKGWDGANPESDLFRETCMGYFLNAAKYINHSEIPVDEKKIDEKMIELCKKIRCIEFHHNLVFIHKGKNNNKSNIIKKNI